MTLKKFLGVLFEEGESLNLRILSEKKEPALIDTFFTRKDVYNYVTGSRERYARDLYFPCIGVNPRNQGKVSAYTNVVIDIDNAPLPDWTAGRADIICSRDDLHHHLYFSFKTLLPNPANRKLYSGTVKALLKLTSSKEKSAHDPERVIRLPGFSHGKTGKPAPGYEIKFIRDDIKRVPFKEKFDWIKSTISGAVPPVFSYHDEMRFAEKNPPKPDDKTHVNSIQYIKNLYLKKPALSAGDGRSRELFFVGLDAHAWGIPQEQAEALADEINKKKFSPAEPFDVVKHQVTSAYRYRRAEFGSLLNAGKSQTDKQQIRARMQFESLQRARDMMVDFIYVHGAERLINKTTRYELTTMTQINNYIVSMLGEKVTLEELLKASSIDCADELDYVPEEGPVFERDGRSVFNKYCAPKEPKREKELKKKAVKIFREHIAYLTTSETEETTLLQFFAYAIQNPGKKLKWAPLIINRNTGTGRGALAELMTEIFGNVNTGTAHNADLTGHHTDYVAEKLLVIVHEVETEDKNVMRSLKSLITEAPLRVIAKYARTYTTTNKANFLFFSNRIDAIRIDDNDRRLFVIYNRRDPMNQEYYDTLYKAFSAGAGWIKDYLMQIDLSGFNPHARPAQTEGRVLLARQSETELSTFLREQMAAVNGPFARPFFAVRELLDFVIFNAPQSASRYATVRALGAWLDGRNYTSYDYHETADGVRKHLSAWFRGSREDFEKARKAAKAAEVKGWIMRT